MKFSRLRIIGSFFFLNALSLHEGVATELESCLQSDEEIQSFHKKNAGLQFVRTFDPNTITTLVVGRGIVIEYPGDDHFERYKYLLEDYDWSWVSNLRSMIKENGEIYFKMRADVRVLKVNPRRYFPQSKRLSKKIKKDLLKNYKNNLEGLNEFLNAMIKKKQFEEKESEEPLAFESEELSNQESKELMPLDEKEREKQEFNFEKRLRKLGEKNIALSSKEWWLIKDHIEGPKRIAIPISRVVIFGVLKTAFEGNGFDVCEAQSPCNQFYDMVVIKATPAKKQ